MSDVQIALGPAITEHLPAKPETVQPEETRLQPDVFDHMLKDAEYLLAYAVEAGIHLDHSVTKPIIEARHRGATAFNQDDDLISALSALSTKVYPVTAETLYACREYSDDAIAYYKRIAFLLAGIIIPLSMISFIYTALSNSITPDLKTANELTITLHTQVDSIDVAQRAPAGSITTLQQFASNIRAIYGHTRQLNWFAFHMIADPYEGSYEQMQLPPNLNSTNAGEIQKEVNEKTKIYQEVRLFATNTQDATSVLWGSVGACILPVLYALLGACAYLLRSFTDQVEKRTFTLTYATTARFIIAAIGGMVVGLFSNFTLGQSASLSPLAVAFLVGYAVDVFFSFLEGSLQNLRGGAGSKRSGS